MEITICQMHLLQLLVESRWTVSVKIITYHAELFVVTEMVKFCNQELWISVDMSKCCQGILNWNCTIIFKQWERSMYGLTAKDVRHLAYEIAEAYNLKHPFNKLTKLAGKDWLKGFFARFPDLSIRIPQGTNLSRAIGFNKPKVQQFFTLYKQILEQRQFLPSQIWNMDETGIHNVHKPGKIIAFERS